MRILYVITKAELGGAQSHLLEVASYFHDQKNEVMVVVGEEGWLTQRLSDAQVPFTILNGLKNTYNLITLLKLTLKLKKIINSFKPDIVHGHSSIAGLISRLATLKTQARSIFTMHGCPYSDGYTWYHRLLSAGAELLINAITNTLVIYVSRSDLLLSEKFHVAPLNNQDKTVIYNGIEELPDRITSNNGPIKVLMIARFDRPKDQEMAIRAAAILKTRPFEFFFIGDGPNKKAMEELTKELHLNTVHFLGAIMDAKKMIKDYDVFLLTSKAEGLPISILEAMSSSLPIVASNVGGIPEVVFDHKNGYLISSGDSKALALALQKFEDRNVINQMGRKSKNIFRTHFSKQQMLTKLTRIYENP